MLTSTHILPAVVHIHPEPCPRADSWRIARIPRPSQSLLHSSPHGTDILKLGLAPAREVRLHLHGSRLIPGLEVCDGFFKKATLTGDE